MTGPSPRRQDGSPRDQAVADHPDDRRRCRRRADDRSRHVADSARRAGRKGCLPAMRQPRNCRRSAFRPCRCATTRCLVIAMRLASACASPGGARAPAKNRAGEPAMSIIVDCATGAEGPGMSVEASAGRRTPTRSRLGRAGRSAAIIVPDDEMRMRLVASAALRRDWSRALPGRIVKHPQQPPLLRAAMVRLRRDRAGHLWAGAAQAAEAKRGRTMMRLTTLDNGLRVVALEMPSVETARSACIARSARATSRRTSTASRTSVEHMVFKGAGGRSARELNEAIEDVGGELNACTERDGTSYTAAVMARTCAARGRTHRRPRPAPAFRRGASGARERGGAAGAGGGHGHARPI